MNKNIQSGNDKDNAISVFIKSQGEYEAAALKKLTITASGFIKHDKVRYDFVTNVEAFIEAQLECINGNGSYGEKNLALIICNRNKNILRNR